MAGELSEREFLAIDSMRADHLATCDTCKNIGSDCFIDLARRVIAAERKRLAERLREKCDHVGSGEGCGNLCAAARIVEGEQ